MSMQTFEKPIGFHLVKVNGAAAKDKDSYRAVLDHNAMSEEDTLCELVEETRIPEAMLKYYGTTILESLIKGTLKDGRSRNFAGLLLTRLDIKGKFDRIDEPYDDAKHKCVLTLLPGAEARLTRLTNPVNETKPPRGRFDYITYPGGEKGFIKIGEPIEAYGHDLRISPNGGYLMLFTYDKHGKECFISCAMYTPLKDPNDMEILENSEDHLKLAWPKFFTVEKLRDQETAKLRFIDCRGLKERHDSFSRPVTILR